MGPNCLQRLSADNTSRQRVDKHMGKRSIFPKSGTLEISSLKLAVCLKNINNFKFKWSNCRPIDFSIQFETVKSEGISWGRGLGQNSHPRGRTFALNRTQGEIEVSLKKIFFFTIFIQSPHKSKLW